MEPFAVVGGESLRPTPEGKKVVEFEVQVTKVYSARVFIEMPEGTDPDLVATHPEIYLTQDLWEPKCKDVVYDMAYDQTCHPANLDELEVLWTPVWTVDYEHPHVDYIIGDPAEE